jgi:hypothetical protein
MVRTALASQPGSSYPLISAARRLSGWTPVTLLSMLPHVWGGPGDPVPDASGGERVTVVVPVSPLGGTRDLPVLLGKRLPPGIGNRHPGHID